jgi:hypothetical protein
VITWHDVLLIVAIFAGFWMVIDIAIEKELEKDDWDIGDDDG